jgi:hypothetical protein
MQRYRKDAVRKERPNILDDGLAEELPERVCQSELIAVFEPVYGLLDHSLVDAGCVDGREGRGPLQACAAEVA